MLSYELNVCSVRSNLDSKMQTISAIFELGKAEKNLAERITLEIFNLLVFRNSTQALSEHLLGVMSHNNENPLLNSIAKISSKVLELVHSGQLVDVIFRIWCSFIHSIIYF